MTDSNKLSTKVLYKLKVILSLSLTNPSSTQDNITDKKGNRRRLKATLLMIKTRRKQSNSNSTQEDFRHKATTDYQQEEESKPQTPISNLKMLYSTTPTDQQCIFIK